MNTRWLTCLSLLLLVAGCATHPASLEAPAQPALSFESTLFGAPQAQQQISGKGDTGQVGQT